MLFKFKLHNILEVMVKASEIMRRAVYTVEGNLSLAEVAKIMTSNRIGSVVVMKDNRPVGIVTDSDVVSIVAAGKDPKKILVKDLKKTKFITAPPETDLFKIVRTMVKTGVKRIPIVKDDKLYGIVSDKEILITTPEMIEVLSEKLKARVENVSSVGKAISGICENCEGYSDNIRSIGGRWVCEDCRD